LIHDIPSVAELVERIVREAVDLITDRLGGFVDSPPSDEALAS